MWAGPRTDVERELLARLERVARAGIADPAFTVERLGSRVGMSRRRLQRSLGRLTGLGPNAWLQELRLETARGLLLRGHVVSEAAGAAGLSPGSLTRLCTAWYGIRPSDARRGESSP